MPAYPRESHNKRVLSNRQRCRDMGRRWNARYPFQYRTAYRGQVLVAIARPTVCLVEGT